MFFIFNQQIIKHFFPHRNREQKKGNSITSMEVMYKSLAKDTSLSLFYYHDYLILQIQTVLFFLINIEDIN